jgi:hypothetical protein
MNNTYQIKILSGIVSMLLLLSNVRCYGQSGAIEYGWLKITAELKPRSRWGWMGSAVDDQNLIHPVAVLPQNQFRKYRLQITRGFRLETNVFRAVGACDRSTLEI